MARYRLFSYETRLARRELESLGAVIVEDAGDHLDVFGDVDAIRARATYLESLTLPDGDRALTHQAAVEQEHLKRRSTRNLRQATRFGPHGFHEYKGKFNPQLARALCNVVDSEADTLIDPFAGSGTALVEGLRLGLDAHGIDQSPIACFIAQAKLAVLATEDKVRVADDLLGRADAIAVAIDRGQSGHYRVDLSRQVGQTGAAYLEKWFTPEALAAVGAALATADEDRDTLPGRLALLALSSILRSFSLQLPEDLRIRRRPAPYVAPPIAPLFISAVDAIRRSLLEMAEWPVPTGEWSMRRGSSDSERSYQRATGRRLILTSPPYATALPYIDTDRLSVVALGLGDSSGLLALERGLIGSREWRKSEQTEWDSLRAANAHDLPKATTSLLSRIADLNSTPAAGFRRKAAASLLYRYFARMGATMDCWSRMLAPTEAAVVVVGRNRTVAGGEPVAIPTPELLGDIAETRGFVVEELIKLETWPRYGLHATNAVGGEDALVIRRRRD